MWRTARTAADGMSRVAFVGLIALMGSAGLSRAGQVELEGLPAQVALEAAAPVQLELGVHAEDPVSGLTVAGETAAGSLLHEGTVMVLADGSGIYAYHDLFLRSYRGRSQYLTDFEGEKVEDLTNLPAGTVPPKVVMDSFSMDGTVLLPSTGDELLWAGDLVWRFDLGLPAEAVSFSDPLGRRSTVVGDADGEAGQDAVTVSLSRDGAGWVDVWHSDAPGAYSTVRAELPASLAGATTLYVRFRGESNILQDFYFTAQVDASAVMPGLALPAGRSDLLLGAEPGGPVIVFWSDADVTPAGELPAPPAVPEVHGMGDRIQVRFPGGGEVQLCRDAAGPVTGLCRVAQDGVLLLDRAPGQAGWARLFMLDGDPIPAYTDWEAERDAAVADGLRWRSTGSRTLRALPLAEGTFVGPELWGDGTVALRQTLTDGDATGELIWLLREEEMALGGRHWRGISWRLIVVGLEHAMYLEVEEPMALNFGQWWIEQVFRGVTDDVVDFTAPYDLPSARLMGFSQSFRFTAGPLGRTLGLFQEPLTADVWVREERGRRMGRLRLPLGSGSVRATPWRSWLLSPEPVQDRWRANDAWAEVREGYAALLGTQVGFEPIRPRPTLVWVQPPDGYFETWIESGSPPDGVYWLDDLRETLLPAAAQAGLNTLYIQAPWDSDAEHSDGGFSGQAIRTFSVSEAIGGAQRMKAMIDRAHELGLEIVLWYPSDYSLYSGIYSQHPEWVMYKASGIPDDGGWGDIVVADLHSAYLPWVIQRLRELHGQLGFDGLWLDSWGGITLATDYKAAQPMPQTAGALQLVRAMWALGIRQVITEGLGPVAQGDAYGDYESWTGPPTINPDVERSLAGIRGKEFLLYGMKAGAPLTDLDMYRRALAAGGLLSVANLDEVGELEPDRRQDFVTANRVMLEVLPLMQRRELVGSGEDWLGVRWRRQGDPGWVLFAFSPFSESVPQGFSVVDLVDDTGVSTEGGAFQTAAWHTYRVEPGATARRRGSAASGTRPDVSETKLRPAPGD